MSWSARLAQAQRAMRRRSTGRLAPTGTPATWLGAGAAGLTVVALLSPVMAPVEATPTVRPGLEAPKPTATTARPGQSAELPAGAELTANVRAAAAYAGEHGWRTGVAVVDTTTGQATTAGNVHGMFSAESTVKVLVATRMLRDGKLTGDTRAKADAMITRSDDAAGDELYLASGGDDLVAWASEHYGLAGLGEPPANGRLNWGSTQVSPLGMARFLAAAKADPEVGPWLLPTMARTQDHASDGTDQVYGLLAVDRTAAVKQGWGHDVPGGDGVLAPSIGYVGGGRYAVAIYTLHLPDAPLADARAMTTAQARILFGRAPTG